MMTDWKTISDEALFSLAEQDPEAQYQLAKRCSLKDRAEAAKWYRKAADQGHAEAQYQLGRLYSVGWGVNQDEDQAALWYEKAARQGHAGASTAFAAYCARQGAAYERGDLHCNTPVQAVQRDTAKAAEWYRKAASFGNDQGRYSLARLLEAGEGVQQDHGQAAALYRMAAASQDRQFHDSIDAAYRLGRLYFYGRGVEQDYAQAVTWFQKALAYDSWSKGNCGSHYYMGLCYEHGLGVEKDHAKAQEHYQRSLPYPPNSKAALYFALGNACFWGDDDREQDRAQAAKWYRRAANLCHPGALEMLGRLYEAGAGVEKDPAQAERLYSQASAQRLKAAEQGDVGAQLQLGLQYLHGEGVQRDAVQAAVWIQKAAEAGHPKAQFMLGNLYYFGRGTEKDYNQAVLWYRKAADQGDIQGIYHLGLCYYNGTGVDQDYGQKTAD